MPLTGRISIDLDQEQAEEVYQRINLAVERAEKAIADLREPTITRAWMDEVSRRLYELEQAPKGCVIRYMCTKPECPNPAIPNGSYCTLHESSPEEG